MDKGYFQKNHITNALARPNALDTRSKPRKLVKNQSKKLTNFSQYDENFIRYVNELDSYFKASELRCQSRKEDVEGRSQRAADYVRYSLEGGSSVEVDSSGNSEMAMENDKVHSSHRGRVIPQISLNSCDASCYSDFETLESLRTASENASYYATPEQDTLSLYTVSPEFDSLSNFVTPSQGTTPEQSRYHTAEPDNGCGIEDELLGDLRAGSQETLFNASSEYDDVSFDSIRDDEVDADATFDIDESAAAISKLNLTFSGRESAAFGTSMDDGVADSGAEAKANLEAKVRRSNFVRSSCIDLEDENKNEPRSTVVVLDEEEKKQKESYLKCCPL